jgi:DNA mismatch repair ATPase MutL
VDQHAVAERIIFEKMRNEYQKDDISLLSVPLTFEITNKIDEKLEKLKEI